MSVYGHERVRVAPQIQRVHTAARTGVVRSVFLLVFFTKSDKFFKIAYRQARLLAVLPARRIPDVSPHDPAYGTCLSVTRADPDEAFCSLGALSCRVRTFFYLAPHASRVFRRPVPRLQRLRYGRSCVRFAAAHGPNVALDISVDQTTLDRFAVLSTRSPRARHLDARTRPTRRRGRLCGFRESRPAVRTVVRPRAHGVSGTHIDLHAVPLHYSATDDSNTRENGRKTTVAVMIS